MGHGSNIQLLNLVILNPPSCNVFLSDVRSSKCWVEGALRPLRDLASLRMPLFSKTDIDEYEVSGSSDFKIWDTNPVGLHCSRVGDKELKEIRCTIRKNRPDPTKDACLSVSAPLYQPDCLLCDSNVRWIYSLAVRPRGVPSGLFSRICGWHWEHFRFVRHTVYGHSRLIRNVFGHDASATTFVFDCATDRSYGPVIVIQGP